MRACSIWERRSRRWLREVDGHVTGLMRFSSTATPAELLTSTLKTWLYAWYTTLRFSHPVVTCWFCAQHDMDREVHYLACPAVQRLVRDLFALVNLPP